MQTSAHIRVHYPLNKLKESPLFVVPTDTDSVWEYYLLENLSCGLVRDDQFASIGYVGCLAESWEQVDPFTWHFSLRQNLRLSNGDILAPQKIRDYYLDYFKNQESRHLKILKTITEVNLLEGKLELKFSIATDRAVLHELSLADAVYVESSRSASQPWAITVGPYRIDYEISNKGKLRLVSNSHSPLFQNKMPKTVDLFQLEQKEDQEKLFTNEQPVDLILLATQANRTMLDRLKANGAVHEVFARTNVVYFYFPNGSPATRSSNLRRQFSEAVDLSKKDSSWVSDGSVSTWDQMIPPGFAGLCRDLPSPAKAIKERTAQDELIIWLRIPIANVSSDFLTKLETQIKSQGIAKKVTYTETKPSGNYFAALMGFLGNQQDPMGSWSYLIASEGAPLGAFSKDYERYFNLLKSQDASSVDRAQLSSEIQCQVTLEAHAVPVIVGSFHSLRSNRVDISRLNRFDNRLRLYELRMKD